MLKWKKKILTTSSFQSSYSGFVMQGDLDPFVTPFGEHTLTQGFLQGSWCAQGLWLILAFAALMLVREFSVQHPLGYLLLTITSLMTLSLKAQRCRCVPN